MLSRVQRLLTLFEQQPSFVAHYSVNALVIDLAAINLQPGPDPSIAISCSVFYNAGNGFFQVSVVGLGW
jgi:hypothetical protein